MQVEDNKYRPLGLNKGWPWPLTERWKIQWLKQIRDMDNWPPKTGWPFTTVPLDTGLHPHLLNASIDQFRAQVYLSSWIKKKVYGFFSFFLKIFEILHIFFSALAINMWAIFSTHSVPKWSLFLFSRILSTHGERGHGEFLVGNIWCYEQTWPTSLSEGRGTQKQPNLKYT